MGYPKKYVGRYPYLVKWLVSQGHSVYPMEMICNPVPVKKGPIHKIEHVKHPFEYQETHYLYGAVDVVSMLQGKLWAWEYKSQTDSLKRGFQQLLNYAKSFDYVCLAAEGSVSGKWYNKFLELGAGIYCELPEGEGFTCLDSPKLQIPEKRLHDDLVNRFRRNVYQKPVAKDLDRKLTSFMNIKI